MTEAAAPEAQTGFSPQEAEEIARASATAIARYDAVAHLRNSAMIANAAISQALAGALQNPEKAKDYAAVAAIADEVLANALKHWQSV